MIVNKFRIKRIEEYIKNGKFWIVHSDQLYTMFENTYTKIIETKDILINYDEKLGGGTYGNVYKGIDSSRSIPVAIKVVKKQGGNYQVARKQLQLGSQVNHINIIKYYEVIEGENKFFIVMEYAGGGTLQSFIKKYKELGEGEGLPQKLVCSLFEQILDGMCALQQNGIVHRDIKPSNILLDQSQKIIKIADFGQAVLYSVMKTLNQGTPLYMAPEVLVPQNLQPFKDRRSDVWSLGLVLYEMLMGKHLFQEKKNNSYIQFQRFIKNKKTYQDPPFPQYLEKEWTTFREKMLAYNYEDRQYLHTLKLMINSKFKEKIRNKYRQQEKAQNMQTLQKNLVRIVKPVSTLFYTESDNSIVQKAQLYLQFFREKYLILTKIFVFFQKNHYPFIPMLEKYLFTYLSFKAYTAKVDKMIKNLQNHKINIENSNSSYSLSELQEPFQSHLRHVYKAYEEFYQEEKKIYEEKVQQKLSSKLKKQSSKISYKYPQISKLLEDQEKQHSYEEYIEIYKIYYRQCVSHQSQNLEQFFPVGDLKTYLLMTIIADLDKFFGSEHSHGSVYIEKFNENLINWKKKKDREEILRILGKEKF